MSAPVILDERFWSKVDKTHPAGCWMWSGARTSFGHGRFKVSGKLYLPHRLSFEATHGPIPEGMDVCHRCDRPGCVNPAHLFLGTRSDNMRDCSAKGRLYLNMAGRRKLLAADLQAIASRVKRLGPSCVAREMGVNRKTLYRFLTQARGGAT